MIWLVRLIKQDGIGGILRYLLRSGIDIDRIFGQDEVKQMGTTEITTSFIGTLIAFIFCGFFIFDIILGLTNYKLSIMNLSKFLLMRSIRETPSKL